VVTALMCNTRKLGIHRSGGNQMKFLHTERILTAMLVLILVAPACSAVAPAATPTATKTPLPPTNTPRPTATPKPTATPNRAATQRADDFSALLDTFAGKGYLEETAGKIVALDPFEQEWAQLGWYRWWIYDDTKLSDFVFASHFSWSSAAESSDISGCGIVFGIQENDDHYAVFLDNSRIAFAMHRGRYSYEVGKTRGSGRVSFENPAEADFAVAVSGRNAYVSVDGEITEYTLSADQSTDGKFGYTLWSGTNRDYGTRCMMIDPMRWTPK